MTEPLADRIARLEAEAAHAADQRRRDSRYSRLGRMREDMTSTSTFLGQIGSALAWVWTYVVRPCLHWLSIPTRWLYREYRRLWAYTVYRRTADDVLVFSKTRAGLFLLGTFGFLWYLLIPLIDCAWDAAWYFATVRHQEHVYLLGSQEINSWTGAHIIEGCSELPCSDRDAVYFRTEGGLFNNLWSLVHNRSLFYPEYVGAAVPYGVNQCEITSYGMRIRFPGRIVNTYSYMLSVTCKPIG